MPIAILTLVPAVLSLLSKFFPAGGTVATVADDVAAVLPNLIGAAQAEFALFQSGGVPTAAQQAQIDSALDQAHALDQAAQPGPAAA